MPIPKPKADEGQADFIKRCMADGVMNKEYPKSDQRFAVCLGSYKKEKRGGIINALKGGK